MAGNDRGRTILKRIPKSLHPSILADSSKLSGKFRKKVLKMIILNTLIVTGIISAANESNNPVCLTTINVGINPPLNNIVNTIKKLIARRPTKSFLERPYAVSTEKNILQMVPTTVTNTETDKAFTIVLVENIYL